MILKVFPLQKKFRKTFEVPGSKSYTNRALLIAALAKGKSILYKPLLSDDTMYMIKALKSLGMSIIQKKDTLNVVGIGGVFQRPSKNMKLYLGNAGTAVRFLTAALTLYPFKIEITGNKRMQERPIQDLVDALIEMGADVATIKNNGCPPLVTGGGLLGGKVTINAKDSSQFLSAVLMTAPYAQKPVKITVKNTVTSLPYIMMTLDIMERFGIEVKNKTYKKFSISPQTYTAQYYTIEPDASSATYPLAIAALHNSTVSIPDLWCSSQQADMAFWEILEKMGCQVEFPYKKIKVTGPKELKPLGTVNLNRLPDAAMTVAILAACTRGRSTLTGLANLRLKETDRLHALAVELTKVGVQVKEGKDFLQIDGDPGKLHGACIETYDDHRIAMCFGVLGTKVPGITILNPACVSKTYPSFWRDIKKLGVKTQRMFRKKSNIILTGMRGSGKSSLGKELAKKLRYRFIDTDEMIEKEVQKTIPEIVAEKGWPYFRNLEHKLCKSLSALEKTVIATGGGIMLNSKNHKLLKKNGLIVFLFCEMDELVKRLQQDYKRPPLTSQKTPQKELEQLWKERKIMYYRTADICLQTDKNNQIIRKKADVLLELLKSID